MNNPCIAPGTPGDIGNPLDPAQMPVAQGLPCPGFTTQTQAGATITVPLEKAAYRATSVPIVPLRTEYQP